MAIHSPPAPLLPRFARSDGPSPLSPAEHRASQISGAPYAAPVEVYGLLLVGAVLGILGGIQLSGEFRPITSYMSDRVHDSETYRPAFVNLNHRGAMRSGR